MQINEARLKTIVSEALAEDLGSGDITSENLFAANEIGSAVIVAREEGVIAGLQVAELVFKSLDPEIRWEQLAVEGNPVTAGKALAHLNGRLRFILAGERVALNFLQRLSGIATRTKAFVDQVDPCKVRILDTRKTTPGLRSLEKYAVRMGGGDNHRFGLYDAALVKDNHIRAAGGITEAVATLREKLPRTTKIEVETETLEQVSEALTAGADMIMLDNMSLTLITEAVKLVKGRIPLEASGKVSLETVSAIAATGVDYISVGALTHSVQSLDIALDFI